MNIELLLNICWAGIAAVAAVRWSVSEARSSRGLIALLCALVILFPAISLTDDLFFCQALLDPHQSSAVSLLEVAKSKTFLFGAIILGAILALLVARTLSLFVSQVARPVPLVLWAREISNRPPPALNLA